MAQEMDDIILQTMRRVHYLGELARRLKEYQRAIEITTELKATYEAKIANAKTDWAVKELQLEQRKAMK
jgi:hypothetical protein